MTDKNTAALAAHHPENHLEMVARWYMIDKDGMATLCTDREDAEKEAKDANMAWPHTAPHRAVQLVEVADVEAMRAGYAAARLEIESLQSRIKTMAEEHADELMVAHLDGMRAEQAIPGVQWQCGPQANGFTAPQADSQPAGADRHGLPPLPDPDLRDVGTNPEDIKNFLRGYATEYAKVALAARAPADSVTAPAGGEIDRLRAALVYVAFALHGKPQYMLAEGIALIDGDTVRVSRDGWTVEASINPVRATPPAQAADSVLEDAAQVEIDLFNDLNRIYGNTLTAYAKELCRLGYRKTNAARKQGETNEH